MRILFISPYPPDRDGIGDYTAALVEAAGEHGHDARVVTPRPQGDPRPEVLGSLADGLGPIERWDPDTVHLQFAVAAFGTRTPRLLRLLPGLRRLRARRVVTLHEVARDTDSLRRPGRALYRRLAGAFDLAIVHTESAQERLRVQVGARPGRATVIPHPRPELPAGRVSPEALRGRLGLGGKRVLLAFGFVHVDKGLDDLVEALGRMRPLPADVHLLVAGDVRRRSGLFRAFELRDRLHLARVCRRIDALGLGERVTFTGYVPAGEVAPLFTLAHGAVLPYRRIEQSGVVHLAAAAGTPVLASTAGGFAREVDAPWSFDPARPDQLAAALADFLRADGDAARATAPAPGSDIRAIAAATLAAYEQPATGAAA